MDLAAARLRPAHATSAPVVASRLLGLLAGCRLDVVLVGTMVALAGLVRWPNLLVAPQFSAGATGIVMALDVADGRAFYLREVSPYIGGPYIWLLGLVYRVFGPSVETTMLVSWAIGALTVVPTYLLGREVGGRIVGGVAAALLATSAAHTVISSHVPISHSLTPLVSTAVLWLVARAARDADGDAKRAGRLLALAGFVAGIALQTHPTVAPLLAGAALGAVLMHRDWLRARWLPLAMACVVLGYSTLLVYHVTSGFDVIGDVQQKQDRYRDVGHDAVDTPITMLYPENLGRLLLSTARLLGGVIDERDDTDDYLAEPSMLALVGFAVVGLVIAVRRRAWWAVGALALALFVPPAFNGKYRPILDGRFLMPLVPVLFVLVGLAVVQTARRVVGSDLEWVESGGGWSRVLRLGVVAALMMGIVLPAARSVDLLDAFYETSIEDGDSNASYLAALTQLQAARRGDEAVLLDPRLDQVKAAGGGKASTSLAWMLAVSRIRTDALDDAAEPASLVGHLAILQRTTADNLDDVLILEPLDGKRVAGKDRPSYRAYRIGPAAVRHS